MMGQPSSALALCLLAFRLWLSLIVPIAETRATFSHSVVQRDFPGPPNTLPLPKAQISRRAIRHGTLGRLLKRQDSRQCGPGAPCPDGSCCNEAGHCGYGPQNCGTEICISNCDAKALCGRDSLGGSVHCPLNVCCSDSGYCGTTAEFCSSHNPQLPCQAGFGSCQIVPAPSCGGDSSKGRSVGYYQGPSSNERRCSRTPDQINTAGLTHLNYAFASIDPSSFAVVPKHSTDVPLYAQFTALKTPSLQTWIAIGGWDFNEPGSTRTTWSDLSSTANNRAKFISSLQDFMAKYGFQGVDLDWEYPGAPDRGGQPQDTVNLVSLVQEMRKAFGDTYGISLTLPAGYWYLRWFDPKAMEPSVNFFNLMTYDLHGPWDANDKSVGKVVKGHTSVPEIATNILPLWFDAVDPSKVNMGLAYYGRGYTLADPSCNHVGCPWSTVSSPGPCTNTPGILSLQEIQDLIGKLGVQPRLLPDDMMKQLTWGNQWIGYDDLETIAMKKKWASSHCFGGTMIWSLEFYTGPGCGNQTVHSGTTKTLSGTTAIPVPSPTQPNSITGQCNKYAKANAGDYCAKFAPDNGITTDQLYAWNTVLGSGGSNCATSFFADYYYCVGIETPAPSSTSTPVPSPTQPNSIAPNCNKYVQAKAGDLCYLFAPANGITTDQLYAWNTVLGSGGSNCAASFFAGYYYCVGVTDSGPPSPATSTVPSMPIPSPTQPGSIAPNCNKYAQAKAGDLCYLFAPANGITADQLYAWNTVLGSGGSSCATSFFAGYYYCVGVTDSGSPSPATSTAPSILIPSPTQPGSIAPNCKKYAQVKAGDLCYLFAPANGITADQLYAWNTVLGSGGSNCATSFFAGYYYCVGVTDSGPSSPSPTQPGSIAPNCNKYAQAKAGDLCYLFAPANGITADQLYAWNTVLGSGGSNCATSFFVGYYYCVGVDESPSTATSTAASSTSVPSASMTSTSTATPSPIQADSIASNCNKYAQAKVGDLCYLFAPANGITTDELYAWNSVLGSGGSNCPTRFFAGYYYCVGISGSAVQRRAAAVPSPTQANSITPYCNKFAQAKAGDYCAKFAPDNGITPDQLYAWNTVLGRGGSQCSTSFFANYYYCVGIKPVPIPSPVQPNSISPKCNKYAQAQAGDYCFAFAPAQKISTDQLYAWNTVLGAKGVNCATSFLAGYYYCVGVSV